MKPWIPLALLLPWLAACALPGTTVVGERLCVPHVRQALCTARPLAERPLQPGDRVLNLVRAEPDDRHGRVRVQLAGEPPIWLLPGTRVRVLLPPQGSPELQLSWAGGSRRWTAEQAQGEQWLQLHSQGGLFSQHYALAERAAPRPELPVSGLIDSRPPRAKP
ncbi:hypothetical protein J7U46_17920 [Pelomonas sp. V22]|uniref:hypothetical protein n=1 Tax=Pelomonas sp. V22 TaxID=2822139 RepID=UPI0024A935AC|nr:hypothetical protein [Pelomonas sp. V22]MDI4634944.1 hypothetical protein [Pelomonas sp. V22]